MTQIETTQVEALVTLVVAPKTGQSLTDAAAEMLRLLKEYITGEHNFLDDYGASAEEIAAYRSDSDEGSGVWGGYEGPFVVSAAVRDAGGRINEGADWHRQMGDRYAQIALESENPAAKTANASEAAKYYAIAERLSGIVARSV